MSGGKDTKKQSDTESTEDFVKAINEQTSDSLKCKLLALYKIQSQRDDILEKGYNEEFYSLEFGYNKEYSLINKELSDIVSSGVPIPHFWKTAIENSLFFTVNDKDKEILNFLTNIEIKHSETDKKSMTVSFHFSQNPFFDHTVLEKLYVFNKKEDTFTEAKSTEIKWKGDAPNIKIVKKKIKKGKTNSTITKEKKVSSFFNIFESKDADDEEDEEKEDDEEANLGEEADFIQNELVPFGMEFYLDLQKLAGLAGNDNDEVSEESEDEKPKKRKK